VHHDPLVSPAIAPKRRPGFTEDFRRFFLRGLAALLPTLITLWLLIKVWSFLWEALGMHIIWGIKWWWIVLINWGVLEYQPAAYVNDQVNRLSPFQQQLLGVGLAIILVYIVGLFVGNIIGRTGWRLIEMGLMRIPLVKAIYPAVKQVTDFLLTDRGRQFSGSRVVAVQPHANGIWSLGLVTGQVAALSQAQGRPMVSVFVPSTPTAFAGYVVVVPVDQVVELPMTVEEALRLLATFGVVAAASPSQWVRPGAQPLPPAGDNAPLQSGAAGG